MWLPWLADALMILPAADVRHLHRHLIRCADVRLRDGGRYVYLRPNEVKRMFEAQLEALMSGGTLGEDAHDKADEPTIGGEGSSSMGGSAMEGAASQTASNRRAQVTMHLLGDEEALDGNERHEYATHLPPP
jgi:hypothetical protein